MMVCVCEVNSFLTHSLTHTLSLRQNLSLYYKWKVSNGLKKIVVRGWAMCTLTTPDWPLQSCPVRRMSGTTGRKLALLPTILLWARVVVMRKCLTRIFQTKLRPFLKKALLFFFSSFFCTLLE